MVTLSDGQTIDDPDGDGMSTESERLFGMDS